MWSTSGVLQQTRRRIATLLQSLALSSRRNPVEDENRVCLKDRWCSTGRSRCSWKQNKVNMETIRQSLQGGTNKNDTESHWQSTGKSCFSIASLFNDTTVQPHELKGCRTPNIGFFVWMLMGLNILFDSDMNLPMHWNDIKCRMLAWRRRTVSDIDTSTTSTASSTKSAIRRENFDYYVDRKNWMAVLQRATVKPAISIFIFNFAVANFAVANELDMAAYIIWEMVVISKTWKEFQKIDGECRLDTQYSLFTSVARKPRAWLKYPSTGNLSSCFFYLRGLISLCSYSFWRRSNYFLSSWSITVIDPGGINVFFLIYSFAAVRFVMSALFIKKGTFNHCGRSKASLVEHHGMYVFFVRYKYTYIYTYTYTYIYKYTYIHMYIYMCMCVCVFVFFVVWCRWWWSGVGWGGVGWGGCGVVWCEWREGRWTNSLKSVLSCFVWWVYCNGQERSVQWLKQKNG